MKFFTVTFQIFDVGRTIVQSYMLMVLLVDTVNNEYPTIALFN
jgi:predicted amino acid-binding ACT domain protein